MRAKLWWSALGLVMAFVAVYVVHAQWSDSVNNGPMDRPAGSAPKGAAAIAGTGFILRSPEVAEGGMLPKEYTGDGSAATLPLEWSEAPAQTRSFAVIMHHVAPDTTKWYWVLYNIPADVTSLPKNVTGIGTLGNNSINRKLGYAPPHSKGPGPKKYTYTVYALSTTLKITAPPEEVSRNVLLAAMKDSILAAAELNVIYSRGEQRAKAGPRPRHDQDDATAAPEST